MEIQPSENLAKFTRVKKVKSGEHEFARGERYYSRAFRNERWHRSQTSRISPDSNRSPRVVDDFQLSSRQGARNARKEWGEVCTRRAHTHAYALLLFTGIGASEYYSSGSALPFIRHCPRTLCGERARMTRTYVRARARAITTRLHGYSIFQNACPEWQNGVKSYRACVALATSA